jgi:hypothetical protein
MVRGAKATPCPSVWVLPGGETVRCIWHAGHQHELDARERGRDFHDGRARDAARVTWLPD